MKILSAISTQVSDLTPLKNLSQLQQLNLAESPVCNVTPLKNLTQLQQLYLYTTQVSDLAPLKDLTELRQLEIYNTQVSDLTPLKKLIEKGIPVKLSHIAWDDGDGIYVLDCPLIYPPPEIVEHGNTAVLNL